MNTQALTQRRAIHAYNEAHREAIYHAERQPEPVQMCAPVDDVSEPLFNAGEAVILALMLGASVAIYFASFMGWLA